MSTSTSGAKAHRFVHLHPRTPPCAFSPVARAAPDPPTFPHHILCTHPHPDLPFSDGTLTPYPSLAFSPVFPLSPPLQVGSILPAVQPLLARALRASQLPWTALHHVSVLWFWASHWSGYAAEPLGWWTGNAPALCRRHQRGEACTAASSKSGGGAALW